MFQFSSIDKCSDRVFLCFDRNWWFDVHSRHPTVNKTQSLAFQILGPCPSLLAAFLDLPPNQTHPRVSLGWMEAQRRCRRKECFARPPRKSPWSSTAAPPTSIHTSPLPNIRHGSLCFYEYSLGGQEGPVDWSVASSILNYFWIVHRQGGERWRRSGHGKRGQRARGGRSPSSCGTARSGSHGPCWWWCHSSSMKGLEKLAT